MAIYVISDLHLSFGVNKPMDVFGDHWKDYENRIKEDWLNKVKSSDTVIIAGDFSWATYLEEAISDFKFINDLPGKKVILKGNHDYWWETVTKMQRFLKENNFENIEFLYNNTILADNYYICGTRYWSSEDGEDNEKIFNREVGRALISLNQVPENQNIIMVTHYPPDEQIINAVKDYNIKKWIYAHIHSNYEDALINIPNIDTYLTSCDYLDFKLIKID